MSWEVLGGDVLERLREIPDESIHCVVTSPPYWGLRDYGTATWKGGDDACDHLEPPRGGRNPETAAKQLTSAGTLTYQFAGTCGKCGAVRIDAQLGLESTPEEYVANMVEVFREVRRVLRSDGTCWLNLGDSYNNRTKVRETSHQPALNDFTDDVWADRAARGGVRMSNIDGLKEKDLVGIPWLVAFALRGDGWWLRSDVIWAKPNPMPESIQDRPTKAHEYVFLLTKSARYFYDSDAIAEPTTGPTTSNAFRRPESLTHSNGSDDPYESSGTRNKRTVWTITSKPYSEAHFATFPPELPEICIKAGTSEKGCCGKCGAPWVRVIERSGQLPCDESNAGDDDLELLRRSNNDADRRRQISGTRQAAWKAENPDVFLGWRSTCGCEPYEDDGDNLIPCTVLDPFAGSGTTLMVALRLGRSAIGIELSPEYVKIATNRIDSDCPLFNRPLAGPGR